MEIQTTIMPIDDETYQSLGALQYVEHPEQENFHQLLFTFKYKYSNQVEEIETEIIPSFRELLSDEIYWTGGGYQYDDSNRKLYTHQEEITIYTGEISEDEIIDLLSKGTLLVKWLENGEEKTETFNIGESAMFTK